MIRLCVAGLIGLLAMASQTHVLSQELFSAPRAYRDGRRVLGSGDFDGDGDIDLVYARGTGVIVELNNGQGRFEEGTEFQVANLGPDSIGAVLDLTGDGIVDLAVSTRLVGLAYNDLLVLAGDGNGAFAPASIIPLGNIIFSLGIGDGNGDGREDLLVRRDSLSQPLSQEILWLLVGPGGGVTFGPPVNVMRTNQVPAPPLELGDFDGNGRSDFVTYRSGITHQAAFWETQGNGIISQTWISSGFFTNTLGSRPLISTVDLDSDGDLDIYLSNVQSGSLWARLWLNDGQGNFSEAPYQVLPVNYTQGQTATFLDLDQDGDLDFIHRGPSRTIFILAPGGYTVFENDGFGVFAPRGSWRQNEPGDRGITPIDLNGDGRLDYVGPTEIYLNRGSLELFDEPIAQTTQGEFFDQDGDGDLDFNIRGSLLAFVNDGTGRLSNSPQARIQLPQTAPGLQHSELYSVDLDGDGDRDLITALYDVSGQSPVFIQHEKLRNDGGAEFVSDGPLLSNPSVQLDLFGSGLSAEQDPRIDPERQMRDLNGDSRLDLIHGNSIYFQDANGRFIPPTSPTLGMWQAINSFDSELDGDIDILAVLEAGATRQLSVFVNDGAGGFTNTFAPGVDLGTGLATLGDADNDGDEDIYAFTNLGANLLGLFLNQGGVFSPELGFDLGEFTEAGKLQVADLNADGAVDILITDIKAPDDLQLMSVAYFHCVSSLRYMPALYYNTQWVDGAFDLDGDGDLELAGRSILTNHSFAAPSNGSRRQFGQGLPGGDGLQPLIGATGPFRVGETGMLKLSGVPGGVSGILTFGSQESNQPYAPVAGLSLYGAPWFATLPLIMPGTTPVSGAGSLSTPFLLPPALANTSTYIQAAFADPLAPLGISATGGLELIIGP